MADSKPILRNELGQIVKGSASCNPGGKLKRVRECFALALDETPASFRLLIAQRDDTDEDARVRQAAARLLIAYGIGEPPKIVSIEAEDKAREVIATLTVEETRNLARLTLAEENETDESDDDDEVDPSAH